jgi:hypothetical protein
MRVFPGLVFAGLLGLTVPPAVAAGPFDGEWTGRSVTEYGYCPHVYDVRLSIRDGRVTGEMASRSERITVATTVDARGRPAHILGYNGRTVLRASGGGLGERAGRIDWWGHGARSFRNGGGNTCYGYIALEKIADRPQPAELPKQ